MASRSSSQSSTQQYEEGGWGWIVLAAVFASEVIVFGNIKAFGVLIEALRADFEADLSLTGWVVSMSYAVQFLTAPLLLALIHLFGCRPVLLFAGIMATAGLLLASYSYHFAAWGVFVVCLTGVGLGFFRYSLFSILATYFNKYFPLTSSIGDIGVSCGTLLYGPITQVLLDAYGWRGAMMILAGVTFNLVPCAAVARASRVAGNRRSYKRIPQTGTNEGRTDSCRRSQQAPSETHGKRLCRRLLAAFDLAILTDVHFVLLTLASCVLGFCFTGWAVYVVPHGIEGGLSPMQSSFLPTSFGVGNIAGRIVASLLLQRKLVEDRWVMCASALLSTAVFIADPFVKSFAGLLLVTCALGFSVAVSSSTRVVMCWNMSSEYQLLSIYSWQALFVGVADMVPGFASGWFFEVTGSFVTTFIVLGVVEFFAVLFLLMDFFVALYKQRQEVHSAIP